MINNYQHPVRQLRHSRTSGLVEETEMKKAGVVSMCVRQDCPGSSVSMFVLSGEESGGSSIFSTCLLDTSVCLIA